MNKWKLALRNIGLLRYQPLPHMLSSLSILAVLVWIASTVHSSEMAKAIAFIPLIGALLLGIAVESLHARAAYSTPSAFGLPGQRNVLQRVLGIEALAIGVLISWPHLFDLFGPSGSFLGALGNVANIALAFLFGGLLHMQAGSKVAWIFFPLIVLAGPLGFGSMHEAYINYTKSGISILFDLILGAAILRCIGCTGAQRSLISKGRDFSGCGFNTSESNPIPSGGEKPWENWLLLLGKSAHTGTAIPHTISLALGALAFGMYQALQSMGKLALFLLLGLLVLFLTLNGTYSDGSTLLDSHFLHMLLSLVLAAFFTSLFPASKRILLQLPASRSERAAAFLILAVLSTLLGSIVAVIAEILLQLLLPIVGAQIPSLVSIRWTISLGLVPLYIVPVFLNTPRSVNGVLVFAYFCLIYQFGGCAIFPWPFAPVGATPSAVLVAFIQGMCFPGMLWLMSVVLVHRSFSNRTLLLPVAVRR